MIRDMEIKGFRGIRELKLENLPQFVVFTGENGAGKTTLLEAALFGSGGAPVFLPQLQTHRGNPVSVANGSPDMTGVFTGFDKGGQFAITFGFTSGRRIEVEFTSGTELAVPVNGAANPNGQLFKYVVRDEDSERSTTANLSKGKDDPTVYLTFSSPIDGAYPGILVHPNSSAGVNQSEVDALSALQDNLGISDLVSVLRILNEKIVDIRLNPSGGGWTIKATLEGVSKAVPLGMLGGGVSAVLRMGAIIANSKDGWVGWDEVENGLHYSIQQKVYSALFAAARANGTQLFMTTHSREALIALTDAALETEEKDFAVIYVRRDSDGNVECIPADESTAYLSLAAGFELR
jgi:AAA domain, putative AbiEii toxin, Type IV TA system